MNRRTRARRSSRAGECRLVAAALAFASIAVVSSAKAEPLAEVGVSAGLILRSEMSGASENPAGVSYGPGFGQIVQAKAPLHRYLRFGIYYQRAYHEAQLPASSLGPAGTEFDFGSVLALSLGARAEPTLPLTPRLRLSAIIGAGWGRITTPKMTVKAPNASYTVYEREGVFVEIPMGLAVYYDIIPEWLAISAAATYAPNLAQTGNLYERLQYVDSAGTMQRAPSFPRQDPTVTTMLGLLLLL